jgi:hypothetical protein
MAQSTHTPPAERGPVLGIALFVLLGTPLVAYLWATLNHLLSGIVDPLRIVGMVPAAALFWLLLRYMARAVESWQATRDDSHPAD